MRRVVSIHFSLLYVIIDGDVPAMRARNVEHIPVVCSERFSTLVPMVMECAFLCSVGCGLPVHHEDLILVATVEPSGSQATLRIDDVFLLAPSGPEPGGV